MREKECPVCGSRNFYIKDVEDEYETYEFDILKGQVGFKIAISENEKSNVSDETEIYCNRCSWHDKFTNLKAC